MDEKSDAPPPPSPSPPPFFSAPSPCSQLHTPAFFNTKLITLFSTAILQEKKKERKKGKNWKVSGNYANSSESSMENLKEYGGILCELHWMRRSVLLSCLCVEYVAEASSWLAKFSMKTHNRKKRA